MKLVDLKIHGTAQSGDDANQLLVILKEVNGERILPIQTTGKRAMLLMARNAISIPMYVPLTLVDIWFLMFDRMHLKVDRVEISSVDNGTCYANVVGVKDGEEVKIEYCQAADGLIVANTFKCRICIDEELLQAQYLRKVGENAYALNLSIASRAMLENALKQAIDSENYEAASKLKAELDKRKPVDDLPF